MGKKERRTEEEIEGSDTRSHEHCQQITWPPNFALDWPDCRFPNLPGVQVMSLFHRPSSCGSYSSPLSISVASLGAWGWQYFSASSDLCLLEWVWGKEDLACGREVLMQSRAAIEKFPSLFPLSYAWNTQPRKSPIPQQPERARDMEGSIVYLRTNRKQ